MDGSKAEYWRQRAERLRIRAETFRDENSREVWLSIADGYDTLARQFAPIYDKLDAMMLTR
jgi:hypothetical protein